MTKKDFMEEKVFDNPELDRLIKKIWARGEVTQDDVRSVCSEPVPYLEERRKMKNLNA